MAIIRMRQKGLLHCVRESVSGEDGLGDDAGEGEHGKAAVLELLQLHNPCLLRVRREELLAEEIVPGIAWA